jgi:hypothetical protein
MLSLTATNFQTVTLRIARIMLEVTGFGFEIYCLAALTLFLVRPAIRRGRRAR